jgi:nanoRNase/pAp phosphatase (c-di-AMP/oligoRNAs hydrolase)
MAYRGIIGRAENRALERFLEQPLAVLEEEWLALPTILVDTQPGAGNNPVDTAERVVAVIDHHPLLPETGRVRHADVRPDLGATATLMTQYLQAGGVTIPPALATALFYGIKTDTLCLARGAGPEEVAAILFLQPLLDEVALLRIDRAQVSPDYFRAFHRALEATTLHHDVLVANIGPMLYPDWAAEMADWFLRLESVQWVICMGTYRDTLHLAVRTRHIRGGAGKLARDIIGRRGVAGGHGMAAGGQVTLNGQSVEQLARTLRDRALRRLNVPEETPALALL